MPSPALLCRYRARLRARRLPQPAAGPANGGWSEVLSVVPPGGSSEAVGSWRLRIDWNNRRALVRETRSLNVDPDLKLSSPSFQMRRSGLGEGSVASIRWRASRRL